MQSSRDGDGISRREVIRGGGALAVAAALGTWPGLARTAEGDATKVDTPPIPRKVLGKTGVEVSILGLGTALLGHQNGNKPEIPKLVSVFSEALDRGINYLDTARIYGGAEEALSQVLKGRRDKVFLVTKAWADTYEEAEKSFEESLRTLAVDHVDVLHLHSGGNRDPKKVLGPRGAWEYLEKMKKDGKARFIGITGHSKPANFLEILATGKVDVMMVAMNFVDRHGYGFEEKVLPEARKRGVGVMCMKVYGGVVGGFSNYGAKTPHPSQMKPEHHVRSIAYAKSLEGVTGMVIGAHSAEQLRENIRRAVETKPLTKEEFEKLCEEGKALSPAWEGRFGPIT